MKLMFYINTISHGGAERVIVNLATNLSERGHECVLVTSFRTPQFEYQYGEKVHRIAMKDERIENPLKRNIQYVLMLRKIVKENDPDVLISFMPEANNRAIIATKGTRTKSIISVRSDPNIEYKGRLFRLLAKTLYRWCDGIVFQTEEAQQWFPKIVQEKSAIILNQVDEVFFQTSYEGERHGIVTAGRLTPSKNHIMLINAFAKVEGGFNEELLIYGEGQLHEELQGHINHLNLNEKIRLMGNTSNVPNALKTAKLFILTSNFEGLPNALMEAMALGLPCISTDCPCGGPRYLFGRDLKHWLVPVGDEQALGERMRELLEDDSLCLDVGKRCRKQAEYFKPEVIIEKWENFISYVNDKRQ